MNKEELNKLIKEITNNPQSLVDITLNDAKRLFDENVSLGVEIDRLRAARFRVNENIEEQGKKLN